MKLAEALQERADLNRAIEALSVCETMPWSRTDQAPQKIRTRY